MSRYLILDVGAGTLDILCFDDRSGMHYKAVARSPVVTLAEKAAEMVGNILITGREMGGGAISQILKQKARDARIVMTAAAALTVHHNLEMVRSWGIEVVDSLEAERLQAGGGFKTLSLGDIEPDRIKSIIEGLGIPFEFDVVGICAQDHGVAPAGVSHLDYRHNLFTERLDKNPHPAALLYHYGEVPQTFNRLNAIAESAKELSKGDVYVMDSGMAAMLGASLDRQARGMEGIIVLDIATSHTVAASLWRGEVAGFFEYHTHDMTLERLEDLIEELADGRLNHTEVLNGGGHGAYIHKVLGFRNVEIILATGPKRKLVEDSRLPITLGAPLGDNMMTGTLGVLNAIRMRRGLAPVL